MKIPVIIHQQIQWCSIITPVDDPPKSRWIFININGAINQHLSAHLLIFRDHHQSLGTHILISPMIHQNLGTHLLISSRASTRFLSTYFNISGDFHKKSQRLYIKSCSNHPPDLPGILRQNTGALLSKLPVLFLQKLFVLFPQNFTAASCFFLTLPNSSKPGKCVPGGKTGNTFPALGNLNFGWI